MKEHFKEQLDAGPGDGVSEQFMVHYIVETDTGVEIQRIDNTSIDVLDDQYTYSHQTGALPVLKLKDEK